jgi:hypothetical protein
MTSFGTVVRLRPVIVNMRTMCDAEFVGMVSNLHEIESYK